ncbi:MAG: thiamine pyrophosphate-binding protein [Deltaproteobacteria bacterium]|nr:thiamine pyrophosphate-binding protein [Deltaproteobacteria bacterium]
MSAEPAKKFMLDFEKPMFDKPGKSKNVDVNAGEKVDCLDIIADTLVEEGVTEVWCLEGSGLFRFMNPIMKRGIKRITCTNEQELGFAAEAFGRIARRPGVGMIGPGTGVTNLATPLHQARSAQAPMVFIVSDSGEMFDGRYTQQGGVIASEVLSPLLKRPVRRLTQPYSVGYQLKQAFRDSVSPVTGPMGIAVAEELSLFAAGDPATTRAQLANGYAPGTWGQSTTDMFETAADSKTVEAAVRWLLEAERPAMICGEGIWFHDAVAELNEFVHLIGIPCHTRRLARGAISEYDPLNSYGRARGKVLREADRALIMGLGIRYLENQGRPPFWGADTRYIQVQSSPELQCLQMPTEFEMNGNMKLILRAMVDCLKDLKVTGPVQKWEGWRQIVVEAKAKSLETTTARAEALRGHSPLHPDLMGKIIGDWLHKELQDDYTTILGGWSATSFYTDWIRLRTAGRLLDATDAIGLGHPVPMAMGAAMAQNGNKHPVLALMGDGDFFGGSGMAYQTAVKWELPIIGIHVNNNSLCTNCDEVFQACYGPTKDFYKDFMQIYPARIKTDEMLKPMGIHTECVERDTELVPALDRCLASTREGVPAFINVIADPIVNNEIMGLFTAMLYGNIPYNDLTTKAKQYLLEGGYLRKAFVGSAEPNWGKALEIYQETGKVPDKI